MDAKQMFGKPLDECTDEEHRQWLVHQEALADQRERESQRFVLFGAISMGAALVLPMLMFGLADIASKIFK
jgi:hypothetical protein